MDLTRRLRSLLAGPRPGSGAVLTVMFLVLTVLGVNILCSVHLDDRAVAQDAGEQQVVRGVANAQKAAAETVPEHLDDRFSRGCSGHQTVTAQYDPVLPSPLALAALPERAGQPMATVMALQGHRTVSSVATARPPSLHALGISRT